MKPRKKPTLTDFEKFHPPQKKSTLHVYWFLRFFPPSTPRLLELCTSFFQKIPPSTFSDLATFAPPTRLFQPPRLLDRWEYGSYYLSICNSLQLKWVNNRQQQLPAYEPVCSCACTYSKKTDEKIKYDFIKVLNPLYFGQ